MSSADETRAAAARSFGADLEDDGLDTDYSMTADYPEELDYYTVLGLSAASHPTETQIRSAYRNLSLSFHPDKQPPHLRQAAERHFTRIQEAYDVLIDPQKRTVYDLQGAEAVKREWGTLGAMGRGGEAQRQDIGVKAMSPDEFRRWYLKIMKKRELKAVQSLVASRGTLTLGINAQSLIHVEDDGDVIFQIPFPRMATMGVSYNFKAPLPLPEFLFAGKEDDEADNEKASNKPEELEEMAESIQVTFNAGIAGQIAHPKQTYKVEYEDGSKEDVEAPLPPIIVAKNINLGATVTPNLRSLAGAEGIWDRNPLAFLRDSTVIFQGLLLPVPTLKTTVVRAFQPIPGIKPIQVTASSIVQRSLWEGLPSLEVQVSKEVAQRKIAFCSWSSGALEWPEFFLQRFSSLWPSPETISTIEDELSSFQIGLVSLPNVSKQAIDIDDDEGDEGQDELHHLLQKQKLVDRSAESWQTHITLSPGGGGFGVTYARNLFSGKPADDPVKTEWTSEGYFPIPKMQEPRAVRLEVSTIVGLDLSISWSVKGTRRIGEYTKMGLGVGLAQNGIVMTISWHRLGQGINLPITVCSPNEANHDAAALATIFPWLAYCAIEFGYIRPRDRKRRRQMAARRHRELKKLIPKKQKESQEAVDLMADQVRKRQDREAEQYGLVITKAEYGYVPPTDRKPKSGLTEPRVVDVTIPVAALVDRGQLIIPENTVKFQIIGFYDPAPLLPKRLKIWYTFHGQEHFVEVGDKESIACPMRAHLVSN